MPEKWQQALSKWDKWNESISNARGAVDSQHGDIAQLLARAKTTLSEEGQDIIFPPIMNTEAEVLWNLCDEVRDIGSHFVSEEVGLESDYWQHHLFVNYWLHSVLPELTQDLDEGYYDAEYLAEREQIDVWHYSRVVKRQRKTRIIDSISWYRDRVQPHQIAEKLQNTEWPSSRSLRMRAKGGRPSEEIEIELEAIVCALLKDKQPLTYREITEQFGWSEPDSNFEDRKTTGETYQKKISQTAVNRVRLGRKILQHNS